MAGRIIGNGQQDGVAMSYRTFKHLLGETSLERKCRFIFGGGIFALVTTSFYLYGQKTEKLLMGQTTQTARRLVNPTIKDMHYKSKDLHPRRHRPLVRPAHRELQAPGRPARVRRRILDPYNPDKKNDRRATRRD